MAYSPTQPFNDLPLLPPAHELETRNVLKRCIAANTALAELKGVGGLIPNQAMLINAIPLQEAQLSSEIENIVTTQDELFRAAADDDQSADPFTREVLRYRTALRHGFQELQSSPFRIGLLQEICGILCDTDMQFRTGELVRLRNPASGEVIYTPPHGADVIARKLSNLDDFLTETGDLDPLVRLAVSHYQFEAIHPFEDGNGRTGRILNLLLLIQWRLLEIPVLYLSRFIFQNRQNYYAGLLTVTETQEWEPWLLYVLQGIEETARWTIDRIHAIHDLFESTCDRCRRELPSKVYSKELMELIFAQPYCKIQFVVDAGLAKRQTASGYLKALAETGVLEAEKHGRETIYRHPALLDALRS